jgi:hypothetical protein
MYQEIQNKDLARAIKELSKTVQTLSKNVRKRENPSSDVIGQLSRLASALARLIERANGKPGEGRGGDPSYYEQMSVPGQGER